MSKDALQVIAPNRRQHLAAIADLMGKVFSPYDSYYRIRDNLRQLATQEPYDWSVSRIGLLDGRLVTHWGVTEYTMRIGTARVRVGGIGAVVTGGDDRKQGHMAATARASLEAMRAAGYDMSVLFGITDFYWRFGYVRAWSESNYFLATANLPKEKPAGRLRRFSRPDRGDLADLYNRQYATTTGTAVHPFWRRRWRPRREGWLWTDARGRAAGYVQVSPKKQSLGCHEFVGEPEAILRVVGHLARRAGCDQVEFDCVPHDGPLARVLRRGTCRVETEHFRNEKALVRTINLASTLGKMAAELTRRLKRSPLAGWRGRLLIADPREQAVLQIGHGGIRIEPPGRCENLIRGGEQIAQLLLGTDEPAETIEAGGIRLRGEARRLADILFPAQHPVISGPDHF